MGEDEAREQALLEELRRSIRGGGGEAADPWSRARAAAAEAARVSADREAGPGARLPFRKRLGRRLLRWYVEPVFEDQRLFNEALLRLVDDLHAQLDELERELGRRG
ncbi:MAG TPA: hypothetical protein VM290_09570 [Gaiellaceae bacterium]|nr:hypothetical protein [Gaiellaceae bacterium]